MISIFGRSKRDEARKKAQAEYDEARDADPASRSGHALTIRAGARAKAHVDKTFITGAEKAVTYYEMRAIAIVKGEEKPEPPKASEYQVIKSVNGELLTYLPLPYAERIFKLGMRYQTMEITAAQAVELVQQVADQISLELQLKEPFLALEFLREELKQENGETDA
ncbi:MAG: hypothetical protein ACKODG_00095, partial [Betaproteobacteria bacterium]